MLLRRLPLATILLALAGTAGVCAAQGASQAGGGNPAAIDQLSIPATARSAVSVRRVEERIDPAIIAAQELELRIAQAQDEAFAAALLEALLNGSVEASPDPLIFISRPPPVSTQSLTEYLSLAIEESMPSAVPTNSIALLRPPARSEIVVARTPAPQPERSRPQPVAQTDGAVSDCAPQSLLWTPACQSKPGTHGTANEAEIKTLDDGVYVKN